MQKTPFIVVHGWMCSDLGLSGNELLVFAAIYGFTQDGETMYQGGASWLSKNFNMSKNTARRSLKKLQEKRLIRCEKVEIQGVVFNTYSIHTPTQNGYTPLPKMGNTPTQNGYTPLPKMGNSNIVNNISSNIDSNKEGSENATRSSNQPKKEKAPPKDSGSTPPMKRLAEIFDKYHERYYPDATKFGWSGKHLKGLKMIYQALHEKNKEASRDELLDAWEFMLSSLPKVDPWYVENAFEPMKLYSQLESILMKMSKKRAETHRSEYSEMFD